MTLSDKAVQEYKKIFKEEYGQELTDKEAREQGENLVRLFGVLFEIEVKDRRRKERLKKKPQGFSLEGESGTYSCPICKRSTQASSIWYDKWGIKCTDCQENIKKNVIPGEICRDDSLYIKSWQLKDKFNIHPQTAKKMVREGKLKERALKDKNGHIYHRVYLLKENKEFLIEQVEGYIAQTESFRRENA